MWGRLRDVRRPDKLHKADVLSTICTPFSMCYFSRCKTVTLSDDRQKMMNQLIDQFIQATDIDTLLILTLKHPTQLLTLEAIASLEKEKGRLAEDDGRIKMLTQLHDIYQDSRENYYFELFTSVRSRSGMRQLRLLIDDDGLDAIEAQAGKVLRIDDAVGQMIDERLNDLHALRQQPLADLQQEQAAEEARLAQAAAIMPLVEMINRWRQLPDPEAAEAYLVAHEADLLSDQAAGILLALAAENDHDEGVQPYILLHKRAREIGAAAAYAEQRAEQAPEQADLSAIEDRLVAWLQTADWRQSEAYLARHASDLLTDHAATVLRLLQQHNPTNPLLPEHQALLAACRTDGIPAAYQAHRAAKFAERQAREAE